MTDITQIFDRVQTVIQSTEKMLAHCVDRVETICSDALWLNTQYAQYCDIVQDRLVTTAALSPTADLILGVVAVNPCLSVRGAAQLYLDAWFTRQARRIGTGRLHPPRLWSRIDTLSQILKPDCTQRTIPAHEAAFAAFVPSDTRASMVQFNWSLPFFGRESEAGHRPRAAVWWFDPQSNPYFPKEPLTYFETYFRLATFDRIDLAHNRGVALEGPLETVQLTKSLRGSHMHAVALGNKIPLPTTIEHDGLPAQLYQVESAADGEIMWDAVAGQLYLIRSATAADAPANISVQVFARWSITLARALTPLHFAVDAAPPLTKEQLPEPVRAIFAQAQQLGDSTLPNPLTPIEQLVYAAWRIAHLLTPSENPGGLTQLLAGDPVTGLQKLFQSKDPVPADCELANAIFFLGARAFGYNVRRVNGLVDPDYLTDDEHKTPSHYVITTPGHAWVETMTDAHYATLDATPSDRSLDPTIAFKISSNRTPLLTQMTNAAYAALPTAPDQEESALAAIAWELRNHPDALEHLESQSSDATTAMNQHFVFTLDRVNSTASALTVYARNSRNPLERGALLLTASVPIVYDFASDLIADETADAILHRLQLYRASHITFHDEKFHASLHGVKNALSAPLTQPASVDGIRPQYQGIFYCEGNSGTSENSFSQCYYATLVIEVNDDRFVMDYARDTNSGRRGIRPENHVVTNARGEVIGLDELLELSFVHVAITPRGNLHQRPWYVQYNAKRHLLLIGSMQTGTVRRRDGSLVELRWGVVTDTRLQLVAVQRTIPEQLDGHEIWPHADGATTYSIDEALRFLHVAAEALAWQPATTERGRALVAQTYLLLLEHPPEFLLDTDAFGKPSDPSSADVVNYFLNEAERLGFALHRGDPFPTALDAAQRGMCISPHHDIPRPCIRQTPLTAAHDELVQMLGNYIRTHRDDFLHDAALPPPLQLQRDAMLKRF